jgi:hypothetical protein
LGVNDRECIDLLEQHGFKGSSVDEYDEPFKKRFIQEYIDLIGALGKELNSLTWWATDISSKNRFSSNVSFLLQQFLNAVGAIDRDDYDHLIILNPSWAILDSLKKVLKNRNKEFKCYENLRKRRKLIAVGLCKRILFNMLGALKVAARRVYALRRLKKSKRKIFSSVKDFYVIKTFIYDHSFSKNGDYRDVFFGYLPEFLKEKKTVLIYASILGNYKSCIDKISKCSGYNILPLEMLVSFSDIVAASIKSIFLRIRTEQKLYFWGYEVSDLVNNELFSTHNGIPYNQFLQFWSTANLFRAISSDTFLLTYENNPWEKMCMMAVRKYSPETAIVGYQHTVVPQSSANMFISREERKIIPMPDKILTVGDAPMKIMERYGYFENGDIEAACALRFEYLFNMTSANTERRKDGKIRILLAVDGIFEVYKMVNYVISKLGGDDVYLIKIRTHPVLPVEGFAHKLICDVSGISNFSVSDNTSLKEDIEWADIIMYWGSTVSLETISMGKPVIHYKMDSVLSYDPLFECEYLKRVVSDRNDLRPVIAQLCSLTDTEFFHEREKAKSYLDTYFFPVTEGSLNKFLF